MPKHCFRNSSNAKTLFSQLMQRQNTVFATPTTPKHCFCNSRNAKTLFLQLTQRQNTVFASHATPKHCFRNSHNAKTLFSQLTQRQITIFATHATPKHCYCRSRNAKTLCLVTPGNTWQHLATTSGRYTDLKHSLYSGAALPNSNFLPFFRLCIGRLGQFRR